MMWMRESRLCVYVIANSRVSTKTLDGGSRILIETTKRWRDCGHTIHFVVTGESREVFHRYGLAKANYTMISQDKQTFNLYVTYMVRMVKASLWALTVKIPNVKNVVVYSCSDFWPESIPAWLLKMRFQGIKWIAAFYLFAPTPFSAESPYKGLGRFKGLLYYISQLPVYSLIKRYADMVWVTSEPDRWKFIRGRLSSRKVVAVRGGVDIKTPLSLPDPKFKRFDAVFIGRFHPQKGILQLVDIWKTICEKRKNAKLAIIGVGDLEDKLLRNISDCRLKDNIFLFGFKDGVEKLKIIKDSKVVVHPAIYDSGGMAACEAMACGLPGVGFDLPALRTYYPKGMLKTPCYDLKAFAGNILRLLNDEKLYEQTAKDALEWAKEWDWDKRAKHLLDCVVGEL
jgi:glycosyltransferase involved in cell wall biosynthesis